MVVRTRSPGLRAGWAAMYPPYVEIWAKISCVSAWAALALLLPVVLTRLPRSSLRDVIPAVAIAAAAFTFRALLPWGPMTPGDAERLRPLWANFILGLPTFASVSSAFAMLHWLGLDTDLILRWWGPLFGALGVAATYVAARVFSLGRGLAAFAAVLLAISPAHLHFSTAPELSVEAGTLATLALLLAALGDVGLKAINADKLAAPLLAAVLTLTIYVRSEWRLMVVPVAILVFGPGWSRRGRLLLAACAAVPLAGYVPLVVMPQLDQAPHTDCGKLFFLTVLHHPVSFGLIWGAVAALGLAVGAMPKRVRIALAVTLVGIGGVYFYLASDPSQQWGQWRYWVTLLPMIYLGTAAGVGVLMQRVPAKAVLAAAAVIAVVSLADSWKALAAPSAEQAAFAFVRETCEKVTANASRVFLIFDPHMTIESSAVLGITAAGVDVANLEVRCDGHHQPPPGPGIRVRGLQPSVFDCPNWFPADGGLVFLGNNRPKELLDRLQARFTLEPVLERTEMVIPDYVNDPSLGKCSSEDGLIGPDYQAHFGWYRLRPRG